MKCPKCGVELSEVHPDEQALLQQIGMQNIPEPERVDYVNKVILSLSEAIAQIQSQPNRLEQAKMLKQFLAEWEQKGEEIILAILYSVKPEYRPAYIQLFQTLTQKT